MALQSISNFSNIAAEFAGSVRAAGTNSPARLANELAATTFKVTLTRPEAIIQGIQASTLKGNPANAQLFEVLARATLLDEPSITNVLRQQTASTDQAQFASRFNMDTSHKQLFRMYINDVTSANKAPKVHDIETPRFGDAAK